MEHIQSNVDFPLSEPSAHKAAAPFPLRIFSSLPTTTTGRATVKGANISHTHSCFVLSSSSLPALFASSPLPRLNASNHRDLQAAALYQYTRCPRTVSTPAHGATHRPLLHLPPPTVHPRQRIKTHLRPQCLHAGVYPALDNKFTTSTLSNGVNRSHSITHACTHKRL